jgi:cob(I)alamin adenosyltransferase
MNSALQPLKEFILPGGSELLSFIHLARTVCRRAERSLVHLSQAEPVNPESVRYLNRLSDLLFILGRFIAKQQGHDEIHWQSAYSRRHS